MSESVNEELNRIKSNIVNTYNTLSDVGLISEGDTNSDNLSNTVKNLSWGGGELCDIGLALFIDESAGMRRLLNGQILNIEPKYKPFLNKLQLIATAYPNILCTEAEWQAIKDSSPFGQVGKFVLNYDETGENITSVRLPAVVNLQGLQDLQYLGDTLEEALPDHTHYASASKHDVDSTNSQGYPLGDKHMSHRTSDRTPIVRETLNTTNASYYSSIYKNNAHVQQEAIQYPYYIQVNLTEYNHMIDVGQIQEINNKVCTTETFVEEINNRVCTTETFIEDINDRVYITETFVKNTEWYRLWSDGYIEQGGQFTGSTTIDANNTKINFLKPFKSIVMKFGGFVKSSGAGTYGQHIFQNGTVTLTYAIASTPSYSTNGQVSHANSSNTGYWYASGY
jgi:hypothetical protein